MPSILLRSLLFFGLLLPVEAFSQEKYLALDKPGMVKRIRFYAGDEIAVKLKNDRRVYEEVIGRITDSTLYLMGTAVPISEIKAVIVRREGGLAEQLVHKLPTAGLLYFLAATFNPAFRGESIRITRSGLIVGGALVGTGQVFRLFLKRTYRINNFRRLRVLETY